MKFTLPKNISIEKVLVVLIFFFSSLVVFQIPFHSMTFFMVFEFIFFAYMFLKTKRFYKTSALIFLIYAEMVISAGFSFFSDLPLSYRKTAVYMTFLLVFNFFTIMYLQYLIDKDLHWVYLIRQAIKAMCMAQIIWSLIQFVCYRVNIDLNKVVFTDTLHLLEGASSLKIAPSGFAWHPSILAPVLVMSFFLFDNLIIRCMALFVAFTCSNATALLGVCLCVFFAIFDLFVKKKKTFKKSTLLLLAFILVVGLVGGLKMGILQEAVEKISYVISRILGTAEADYSGIAHKRYFTAFPAVMYNSNLIQILFGYGTGCSGYPIDVLYDQYSFLSNWAVECDFMNIMYSQGIIGFILYYIMVLHNIFRGLKIDSRYAIVVFIIMLQGITYNVQYEWMVLIMLFMYVCIKKNVNIFNLAEDCKAKEQA